MMEESIMESRFVETATTLIDDFETTIYGNMESIFSVEDSTLPIEASESIHTVFVSPETMYNDFVTSLDREELEFLADYSACSEYPIVPSFQDIHFQMSSTLDMTDILTGCSPMALVRCDSKIEKVDTEEQGK